MNVHQRIKVARIKLGLTFKQFGDAVGVSHGAVQQWEKLDGLAPSRRNQPAVAKMLGITVSELMSEGSLQSGPAPELDAGDISEIGKMLGQWLDRITNEKAQTLAFHACVDVIIQALRDNQPKPSPTPAPSAKKTAAKNPA